MKTTFKKTLTAYYILDIPATVSSYRLSKTRKI